MATCVIVTNEKMMVPNPPMMPWLFEVDFFRSTSGPKLARLIGFLGKFSSHHVLEIAEVPLMLYGYLTLLR